MENKEKQTDRGIEEIIHLSHQLQKMAQQIHHIAKKELEKDGEEPAKNHSESQQNTTATEHRDGSDEVIPE